MAKPSNRLARPPAQSPLRAHGADNCHLGAIAIEVTSTIAAILRTDEEIMTASEEDKIELRALLANLDDSFDGLKTAASHLRANCGLGALFQLHLLHDYLGTLLTLVPNENQAEAQRLKRSADRLAYSLQAWICHASTVSPANAAGDLYMPQSANPWAFNVIRRQRSASH